MSADPIIRFCHDGKIPNTLDLCDEDEDFKIDNVTENIRIVKDDIAHDLCQDIDDDTEVDVEASSEIGQPLIVSDQQRNDVENYSVDEDSAIEEMDILKLDTLTTNDGDHLSTMCELACKQTIQGVSQSLPEHITFLAERHCDNVEGLEDLFPLKRIAL